MTFLKHIVVVSLMSTFLYVSYCIVVLILISLFILSTHHREPNWSTLHRLLLTESAYTMKNSLAIWAVLRRAGLCRPAMSVLRSHSDNSHSLIWLLPAISSIVVIHHVIVIYFLCFRFFNSIRVTSSAILSSHCHYCKDISQQRSIVVDETGLKWGVL